MGIVFVSSHKINREKVNQLSLTLVIVNRPFEPHFITISPARQLHFLADNAKLPTRSQ